MASKRLLRRKACGDKRRFESEQDARRAVLLIARNTGNVMQAYRCQFAAHWHLGHDRTKVARERMDWNGRG